VHRTARHALALSAAGYSLQGIGDVLGVTKSTTAEHLRTAVRNAQKALDREAAAA